MHLLLLISLLICGIAVVFLDLLYLLAHYYYHYNNNYYYIIIIVIIIITYVVIIIIIIIITSIVYHYQVPAFQAICAAAGLRQTEKINTALSLFWKRFTYSCCNWTASTAKIFVAV